MPREEKNNSKRTVKVFSIASFLNDMGSDMIYPVWPLFVTSFLGANMAVLGLIDGLGDAFVSISQGASGYLSDRWGRRKPFIWLGYSFGAISRIGYAFSSFWQMLVPFKVLDRFGKMRGAPRDAIIADVSTDKNRGKNFGLLRAADNLGALAGIIISILLFNYLGFFNLFLLAAIPSIIGTMLIIAFIKDRKTKNIFKGFSLKQLNSNFRLFLLSSALLSIATFSYSFLLVYAKEAGFAFTFVPVFYLIFTLSAAIASIPLGKAADKLGRKKVLFLSYLIFISMSLSFILFDFFIGLIVAFILYGFYLSGIEVVQRTFVSELADKRIRATSLGTFKMIVGLCALPASLIAGFSWISFGKTAPFIISIALTTLALIPLAIVKENK